jgi:type III secretion protein L
MASFIFIENNRIRIPSTTKVIKADSYTGVLPAEDILSEAQSKAEEMISKARKQAEEIVKEAEIAYRREKQRGYREGLEKAKQEMAVEISATSLKTSQYYHAVEKKIVALVMDTVRKVIDISDNGELIISLAKKALLILKSQKQITLKVAPDQVEFVNERMDELMHAYPNIDTIEVKGDKRMPPTDLILESEIGIVNAGIETQLTAIEQAFSQCFLEKKSR